MTTELSLDDALRLLATAHTRDDGLSGFTVSQAADTFMIGIGSYIDAWKAVRQHLHLQTEPAVDISDIT